MFHVEGQTFINSPNKPNGELAAQRMFHLDKMENQFVFGNSEDFFGSCCHQNMKLTATSNVILYVGPPGNLSQSAGTYLIHQQLFYFFKIKYLYIEYNCVFKRPHRHIDDVCMFNRIYLKYCMYWINVTCAVYIDILFQRNDPTVVIMADKYCCLYIYDIIKLLNAKLIKLKGSPKRRKLQA